MVDRHKVPVAFCFIYILFYDWHSHLNERHTNTRAKTRATHALCNSWSVNKFERGGANIYTAQNGVYGCKTCPNIMHPNAILILQLQLQLRKRMHRIVAYEESKKKRNERTSEANGKRLPK